MNETKTYILNNSYSDKVKIQGLITNAPIASTSSYHFHSLTKFNRGDILLIDDYNYMITSDVIEPRVFKYKGVAEYCNYEHRVIVIERVVVGTDNLGRPIYEDRPVLKRIEYGVLRFKEVSFTTGDAINVIRPQYILEMRDTTDNRDLFKVNFKLTIGNRDYSIYHVNSEKRGILELRLY